MEFQEDAGATTRVTRLYPEWCVANFLKTWKKKFDSVIVRKEDMNKLVMAFLVTEGLVDAAEKFNHESGTERVDLAMIMDRCAVRKAVWCGNIEDAIGKINELNPEILNKNHRLYFRLQQQRFIEYIRDGKIDEALEIAQAELKPCAEKIGSVLEELERTVVLLAFEDPSKSPTVGELLKMSQRLKTAREINAAILMSQGREKDPKLDRLLKMRKWVQMEISKMDSFPYMYFSDPSSSNL